MSPAVRARALPFALWTSACPGGQRSVPRLRDRGRGLQRGPGGLTGAPVPSASLPPPGETLRGLMRGSEKRARRREKELEAPKCEPVSPRGKLRGAAAACRAAAQASGAEDARCWAAGGCRRQPGSRERISGGGGVCSKDRLWISN